MYWNEHYIKYAVYISYHTLSSFTTAFMPHVALGIRSLTRYFKTVQINNKLWMKLLEL